MAKTAFFTTLSLLLMIAGSEKIDDTVQFKDGETTPISRFSDASKEAILTRRERSDDAGPLDVVVSRLTHDVSDLSARLQAAENTIADKRGSTYVRWGRSQCPNGSLMLYSGFAGGSDISDSGSGSNRLCLSPDPVFDDTSILGGSNVVGTLHGAQYYLSGHRYTDVLCAVCYTPLSTTFMVPGTNRCPPSTTLQYSGYLTSEAKKNPAQADYVCLDAQPEDHPGSAGDQRPSGFFEHVVTVCSGSLPCPPYVDHKIVTCAVCSK